MRPFRGGVEVGRILDEILGVDVGALLDQETRDLDAVAVGRRQQRRAPALVACVDAGAAGEKLLHHDKLAALGRGDHLALGLVGLLARKWGPPHASIKKKKAAEAAFAIRETDMAGYAAAVASSSTLRSCTGPESRPLAASSRSTNSITPTAALSPWRKPALRMRV